MVNPHIIYLCTSSNQNLNGESIKLREEVHHIIMLPITYFLDKPPSKSEQKGSALGAPYFRNYGQRENGQETEPGQEA
jgi:hypothetical protein